MTEKNQIQKTEPQAESPLAAAAMLLQKADGKIDVGQLEALLKVQMQYEANEAKKAYVVAMAAFKADPPEIFKDKTVSFGQTSYSHATLSNVTALINKALSGHGLTASWVTSQENGSVKVTCKITHVFGHSEETCLSAAPDKSGSKNDIQAIGSTVTYLQRYTLLALTGLATSEQDDDGKGADPPPGVPMPSDKEQLVIDAICEKLPVIEGKLINSRKVAAIIYAQNRAYPSKESSIEPAVEWFMKKDRPEMYMPDNRSQFEKDNNMPGDADSVPDEATKEAEQTAKEKFGKETEQAECRYICNSCDREFDLLNKTGLCPSCFSNDTTDRRA